MSIDYKQILNETLQQFLKKALLKIEENGFADDQLCYITFLTFHPTVILSPEVKKNYPHEITIILQYEYEDLRVYDNYFSVKLSFNDVEETIVVPYNSITSFSDPNTSFYLKFSPALVDESKANVEKKNKLKAESSEIFDDNKVINLANFRNKNKTN